MTDVIANLKGVIAWHRHRAAQARAKAADKRASRFTREDYENEHVMHTYMADTIEAAMKERAPRAPHTHIVGVTPFDYGKEYDPRTNECKDGWER